MKRILNPRVFCGNKTVSFPAIGGVGFGSTGKPGTPDYGAVSDRQAIDAITTGVELGINFIDVSPLYGDAERRVGEAMRALGSSMRKELVLQTKVGRLAGGKTAYKRDGVLRSVEQSLKSMNTDYLDSLLIHDPDTGTLGNPWELTDAPTPHTDEVLAPGGGWETLQQLKKEGVVHAIGIGTREHGPHRRLMETGQCDVILTYLDYNLLHRSALKHVFPTAEKRKVTVINASAFYTGLLAGKPTQKMAEGSGVVRGVRQVPQLMDIAERMYTWCESKGVPLRAMALQFSASHPVVCTTVCGCRTAEEVRGIVEASQVEISKEVWNEFDEVFGEEVRSFDKHWYIG